MTPDLRIADLPTTVCLFPIDRLILLPETTLPMTITEPKSQDILDAAEAAGGYVGIIQTRMEPGERPRFYDVGCLGRIASLARDEEGHHTTIEGVIRFRVHEELEGRDEIPQAVVGYEEFARDLNPPEEDVEGWDLEGLKARLLKIGRTQTARDTTPLETMSPRQLVRVMAQTAPLAPAEKQALLEARSFRELLELLFQLLALNFLTTTPDTSPSSRTN